MNNNDTETITITHKIKVDRCIANEIIELNNKYNILTLASCCGHGIDNGFIAIHDDSYKFYEELIEGDKNGSGDNVLKMLKLGYKRTEPYSYLARNASLKSSPIREYRKKIPTFVPKSKCNCKIENVPILNENKELL